MYSTLVKRTPVFAEILLPGSRINLSLLPINFSSKAKISSLGDGGASSSYLTPSPPPRSRKSNVIPSPESLLDNSKILFADSIYPSRSKICDPIWPARPTKFKFLS